MEKEKITWKMVCLARQDMLYMENNKIEGWQKAKWFYGELYYKYQQKKKNK